MLRVADVSPVAECVHQRLRMALMPVRRRDGQFEKAEVPLLKHGQPHANQTAIGIPRGECAGGLDTRQDVGVTPACAFRQSGGMGQGGQPGCGWRGFHDDAGRGGRGRQIAQHRTQEGSKGA